MNDLLLTMLKEQLDWGWIELDVVKQDVVQGLISADDYKTVTGQDYVA